MRIIRFNIKKLIFPALALMLLSHSAMAGSGSCGSLFPAYSAYSPTSPPPTSVNIASFSSLIGLSLAIISLMFAVTGIIYAIGHAFAIDKLTRFAKTEFGEIAITIIVVGVFLGTFSATNSIANSNLFAAAGPTFNSNIFIDDCNAVMSASAGLLAPELAFAMDTVFINIAAGTTFNLQLSTFGMTFSPYAGDLFLSSILQTLTDIGGLMIGLLFGLGIFLAVIYGMFPMFLFAGIVLRSLPITRAAGGAMLGLFAGFYILLPIMLHFFLFYNPNYLSPYVIKLESICPSGGTSSSLLSACSNMAFLNNFESKAAGMADSALNLAVNAKGTGQNAVSVVGSLLNGTEVQLFIQTIIEPVFYTIMAFVLSLIMAYDFMEAVGDLLGAPSLSASTMLKNVI
jgi:hypothetical protein